MEKKEKSKSIELEKEIELIDVIEAMSEAPFHQEAKSVI